MNLNLVEHKNELDKHSAVNFDAGNNVLKILIYSYGIYALFLLLECIDFLSLLHNAEPGFHATYNIVHVAFFMVELIVYASLTLGMMLLHNFSGKNPLRIMLWILAITTLRLVMIYYLYWQTEPKVHFVPYIYKKSNDYSGIVRGIILPVQILLGLMTVGIWNSIRRRSKVGTTS